MWALNRRETALSLKLDVGKENSIRPSASILAVNYGICTQHTNFSPEWRSSTPLPKTYPFPNQSALSASIGVVEIVSPECAVICILYICAAKLGALGQIQFSFLSSVFSEGRFPLQTSFLIKFI